MDTIYKFENGLNIIRIYIHEDLMTCSKDELVNLINLKSASASGKIIEGYVYLNTNIHTDNSSCNDIVSWNSQIYFNIDDILEHYMSNFKNRHFSYKSLTENIRVYSELNILDNFKPIKEKGLISKIRDGYEKYLKNYGFNVDYDRGSLMVYCEECGINLSM